MPTPVHLCTYSFPPTPTVYEPSPFPPHSSRCVWPARIWLHTSSYIWPHGPVLLTQQSLPQCKDCSGWACTGHAWTIMLGCLVTLCVSVLIWNMMLWLSMRSCVGLCHVPLKVLTKCNVIVMVPGTVRRVRCSWPLAELLSVWGGALPSVSVLAEDGPMSMCGQWGRGCCVAGLCTMCVHACRNCWPFWTEHFHTVDSLTLWYPTQ